MLLILGFVPLRCAKMTLDNSVFQISLPAQILDKLINFVVVLECNNPENAPSQTFGQKLEKQYLALQSY